MLTCRRWRRLRLQQREHLDVRSLAFLPLHSLTQPLEVVSPGLCVSGGTMHPGGDTQAGEVAGEDARLWAGERACMIACLHACLHDRLHVFLNAGSNAANDLGLRLLERSERAMSSTATWKLVECTYSICTVPMMCESACGHMTPHTTGAAIDNLSRLTAGLDWVWAEPGGRPGRSFWLSGAHTGCLWSVLGAAVEAMGRVGSGARHAQDGTTQRMDALSLRAVDEGTVRGVVDVLPRGVRATACRVHAAARAVHMQQLRCMPYMAYCRCTPMR